MSMSHRGRILVVDDEPQLCNLLTRVLKKNGHTVASACHGKEALEKLSQNAYDMVISDINMPVMDGFDLMRRMDESYPDVKRVLITGGDINEYISIIRKHNIGNVLSKGEDFHISEIRSYIENLLVGDVFGLKHYFSEDTILCEEIRNESKAQDVCHRLIETYGCDDKMYLEIAVNELISNAVFHGLLEQSGISRDQWNADYDISEEKTVTVHWAVDEEKLGVAVTDPRGKLTKKDVLRWLDHKIDEALDGEEHGRGFLLIRGIIDRFIINIERGKKTECILIQYKDKVFCKNKKPLLVHEI